MYLLIQVNMVRIMNRVQQLKYVAYVRTPNFIGMRMILDLRSLTCKLIFSLSFFTASKIFLVHIILYSLKTYRYIFDL